MTFSCMFSCFSWNALAQIPPRGSFIQKCRFAFGEWLALRQWCMSCSCSAAGCCTNTAFAPGTVLGWGQSAGALGKQHSACGYCWFWLSWHSHSAALGWGGAHLVPLAQSASCPGLCCASSCASAAAHHSSCLEFRN